ncbi:NCS1 family nucleobase:cation symporter-1, partial [Streptomyces daliensis]|nr:NCS1 family nucleobase:cation symporter-1 [Streptomyces daliensis]
GPGPAPDPDPRLHNADLAPAPAAERRWGTYSIFAMWMSDTHAISNYAFAASLFVIGLPAWEVFLSLLVGVLVLQWFMNRMGHAGHRTGVPFPVLARASWGIYGANIPALLRAVMAVAWYGIQTWLASKALVLLGIQVAPSLAGLDTGGFLGQTTLGWISFLVMWGLQALLLTRGMEFIRRVQDFATGPVVWVVMLALAGWLLVKAGGDISLTRSLTGLSAGEQFHQSAVAVALTVATFLTLALNYADFARFTPDHRSYRRGNLWGLPVNFTAFAVAAVLMTAGTVSVFGEAISDPVEVIHRIDNPWVTVIGAVSFMIATVGINVVANFVSPAYDFANLAPKYLDFKRGGMVTALLAIVVMPWKLYSSPVIIQYFLGALGAFLGPLVAVLLVDYYLIRRGRIDVDALFTADPGGAYHYRRGYNMRAVAAFVPSAAVCAVLALVPAFSAVAPFSWIVGLLLGGGLYYALSAHRREHGELAHEVLPSRVGAAQEGTSGERAEHAGLTEGS